MEAIEFVAANLEEAKQLAADQLGVSTDEVTVTIIEETRGLFGKARKIKVRAEATKPKAKRAPAKSAKEVEVVAEAVIEAPAPTPTPAPVEVVAKPERAPRAAKPKITAEEKPADEKAEVVEDTRPAVVASQEDADQVIAMLNGLFEKANLAAEATLTTLNGRYINVGVDGKDVGYLVGRRGEVLNALQYLTNVIVSRKMQSGVRVTLDGDDYRRRREEALTQLAVDIATQVRERGEEAVLDALPAFERRVVHQALVDFEGVTSYSEGEEPNRRVVIGPA